MTSIKAIIRSVKEKVGQYDPIEVKVREATSSDKWGAKSTLMAEIARSTNDHKEYNKLFAMLWKRLKDDSIPIHVLKAMILIEYLLRNGSDRFIRDVKDRIETIDKKKRFQAKSTKIEDQDRARQVRRKAAALISLISDEKRLQRERLTADRIKNVKNSAISHDSTGIGGKFTGMNDASKDTKGEDDIFDKMKKKKDDNDDDDDFGEDPFDAKPKKKKPSKKDDFEDDFNDDPFETKPKKKKEAFRDDPFEDSEDPFEKQKSADPFASAPAAAADPFDEPKRKPREGKRKKGKKPKAKPAAQLDVFEEPAQEKAPAASANGGGLEDLFNAVNIDGVSAAGPGAGLAAGSEAAPGVPKQPSVDFLSGALGGGEPEPSNGGFPGFSEPEAKKEKGGLGMVNLDNIMEARKASPKVAKKSMLDMQQGTINVDYRGVSGQQQSRPPATTGAGADVFFGGDSKQNALEGMFGGSSPAPQPVRPPLQQQWGAQQGGYPGGYYPQQGYGAPAPGYGGYGGGYGMQPQMGMQSQPMMGNPFLAQPMQAQPQRAPAPAQAPKQDDAFNGLAW
ncbi:hypothetical protein AAMO2058_000430000 [Amorphochlora amoebiformis]